jgi:uncharacterized protein YrzB (UPF0473 family)
MNHTEVLNRIKIGKELHELKISGELALHHLMSDESKIEYPLVIRNCDIEILEASVITFTQKIVLDNCNIKGLRLHGMCALNGITIKDCSIQGSSDISCCIINSKDGDIIIEGNQFGDIATFEDTNFKTTLIFRNNEFEIGTDLQTVKQLQCSYPENSDISGNTGVLNMSPEKEEDCWKRIRKMHNNG